MRHRILPLAVLLIWLAVLGFADYKTYYHGIDRSEFDQSKMGMSSLTFVFDRTGSMFDDLDQVRKGTEGIFNTVMKQRKRFIYNYVLVMFHDPGIFRFYFYLKFIFISFFYFCFKLYLLLFVYPSIFFIFYCIRNEIVWGNVKFNT